MPVLQFVKAVKFLSILYFSVYYVYICKTTFLSKTVRHECNYVGI